MIPRLSFTCLPLPSTRLNPVFLLPRYGRLPSVKGKISSAISLGDVAKAAKVSRMTVSYALRNNPNVSLETQERIQRIAKQLGYTPDARIASWMAKVRGAKTKDLLPIAWLNTSAEKDSWHKHKFHSPFLEGAQERCGMLGYRIEEFWTQQPGMTMQRLSQILYQRGIEGVLLTYPARHLRLKWDHLACVALGGGLLAPRLHRVALDTYFNLTLALKILRRYGYRRIGICLSEQMDRFTHGIVRSVASHLVATTPSLTGVPFMIYGGSGYANSLVADKSMCAWMRGYRPEVIVCGSNQIVDWVRALGFRVPDDVGVVHLSLDDDVLHWAGIHSNKREVGAAAAEWGDFDGAKPSFRRARDTADDPRARFVAIREYLANSPNGYVKAGT